jgi:hypothetical protein
MPLFALLISSALGPRATTAALGLVLPSSNSMPACLPALSIDGAKAYGEGQGSVALRVGAVGKGADHIINSLSVKVSVI